MDSTSPSEQDTSVSAGEGESSTEVESPSIDESASDSPSVSPSATAHLQECVGCKDQFEILEMRAWDMKMYCRPCHRQVGVDPVRGPPPPVPVIQDIEGPIRRPTAADTLWPRYTELRRRLEQGADTLEFHKEAAETAARLDLLLESVEHYKACVRLAPGEERFETRLANVQTTLDRQAALDPETGTEPSVRRVPDEAKPFWKEIGAVVAYPFQGRGSSLMVVAGAFFGILSVISAVNLIGWLISLCLVGYVASYMFEVINSTASGKHQPPDLPEPASFLDSYVYPFFALLSCLAISYLPVLFAAWMWMQGWVPPSIAGLIMLAGFVLGTFIFPMTLMLRSLFQDIAVAVNPKMIFGSIGRILPDYTLAFVAICVIWVGYTAAYSVVFLGLTLVLGRPTADAMLEADAARVLAWILHTILTWPLLLYAWLLQGHLLGRLYRQGVRRLAWFHRPTEDTLRATRLSVGIAVAGCAAALIMSGAVYTAYAVYSSATGASAAALLEDAPLRPNCELTYYWEHTDGPRGLTTYRFEATSDGNLSVTAITETTENIGLTPARDHVGIIDRDTGILLAAPRLWIWDGNPQQMRGQHTIFYGPSGGVPGDVYINDWPIRSVEPFQDTWVAWKVHDTLTTSDLYYDYETGIYLGRELRGIGFAVSERLVHMKGISGVSRGPRPGYDFTIVDFDR